GSAWSATTPGRSRGSSSPTRPPRPWSVRSSWLPTPRPPESADRARRLGTTVPPTFKPVYLIHGDDHGRIAERRARLRALAESISGAEGVELLEGEEATPDAAAAALDAMTLTIPRRFIVVDGAERWKDKDLDALEAAIAHIAPE